MIAISILLFLSPRGGTDDTPCCAESSLCSVYAMTSGLPCLPAAETLPRRDETYSFKNYECSTANCTMKTLAAMSGQRQMRTKRRKKHKLEKKKAWKKIQSSQKKQAAIDRLKCGKARESNGIRAEDIKGCDEETKEWIRHFFFEVQQQKRLYTGVLAENSKQSHIQDE